MNTFALILYITYKYILNTQAYHLSSSGKYHIYMYSNPTNKFDF